MNEVDRLLRTFTRTVEIPWQNGLSGAERVWFAVYKPAQERVLLKRMVQFELATTQPPADHRWHRIDLADRFGDWMAAQEYRDGYFARPKSAQTARSNFESDLVQALKAELAAAGLDANTLVAITGAMGLFGLLKLSSLVKAIEDSVPGRLLVFFPGEYENHQFRFLDARDGWNYHALPITATKEF